MESRVKLEKYFKERIVTINSLVKKGENKYTPSDFHTLRVAIKKVKAFLILLEKCSKGFDHRSFSKPFSDIFKAAGKVRELQVERSILKKYYEGSIFNEFLVHLKETEQKYKTDFFCVLKIHPKIKIRNEILQAIKKLNERKLPLYFKNEENKIYKVLKRKKIKAKKAHKVRRHLKMLFYNEKSVNPSGKDTSLKKQEKFQQLLGKWHDYKVIRKHLKDECRSERWNKYQKEKLKKLKKQFADKHKMLFKEIKAVRLKI
jgi:CHAD domain-containing protein